MASIIRHAMRLTSVRRLLAVIGGFHLSGPAFEPVVAALTGLAPELIAPGHCTGWRVQHILAAMLPDAWVLDEPAIPRSGPDWLTVSPEPWRLPHVIAEAERMTRYPNTVVLRAAYCKSPEVTVDVEPREVVGLLCAADGSASGRVRSAFLFGHAVQVNIQLTRE